MKITFSSIFIALILQLFLGCENNNMNSIGITSNIMSKKRGEHFGQFSLELSNGTLLKARKHEKGLFFDNIKDKVVLLSFFTTWCPPCKAEIPHLVNLQKNYKNHLEVVGILMEDSKSQSEIERFIDTFEINFKIAISHENQKLAKALGGIRSIPFMILYNPQGEYITHYIGAVPEEMIEFDIKRAMAKSL